jgi:hypothetical protein
MDQETQNAAAIEAGIGHIRALGTEALRKRWRLMSGATPPKGLTKDLIARMIAYRVQCEAFGGLDRETVKLLNRLARGGKPQGMNRRLKTGPAPGCRHVGVRLALIKNEDTGGFVGGIP